MNKTNVLNIRISDNDLKLLKEVAAKRHKTVSSFVRDAAKKECGVLKHYYGGIANAQTIESNGSTKDIEKE